MSANIFFKKYERGDDAVIREWFTEDVAGAKFLSSYATDHFGGLVDFEKRYFWIAVFNKEPIGFFDFELESKQKGFFSFYVRPDYRGQGVGLEIIARALAIPEVRQVAVIVGGVERDNLPSVRTLEKADFQYSHTDADGMLVYALIFAGWRSLKSVRI